MRRQMPTTRPDSTTGVATTAALMALAFLSCLPAQAGGGAVALQSADPSCANDSGDRYVDCGNGTVTDNDTGLVWLKNANCFGAMPWQDAMTTVAGLADLPPGSPDLPGIADTQDCGLSDGSSPGEWRMPTIGEWEVMVAAADALGCSPTITNDGGEGCWIAGICFLLPGTCSFDSVLTSFYWSSTSGLGAQGPPAIEAMGVALVDGSIGYAIGGKSQAINVWPVRGGQ